MDNTELISEVRTDEDFWTQIEKLLDTTCEESHEIDDVLRSYLALIDQHRHEHLTTDEELNNCAYLLYSSALYAQHTDYVRRQLIYCLLQDDDAGVLRITLTFLLSSAREDKENETFYLLNQVGERSDERVFPRLSDLISHPQSEQESTHRLCMEMMYEMSRVQKISHHDLASISDEFTCSLFDIIEQLSDDINDPYHYPVIRVLLVLNEQFMVAAHDPEVMERKAMPPTNKITKILSMHGSRYKTFGANLILLLNREDETSLQLLTLKLMYLLFTTPKTYEYFYTNDLRVLVDILVRNLLDLPESATSLRHTYLRVLFPLLERTQLQQPPYYKREEIKQLLAMLGGDRVENEDGQQIQVWNHFEDVDETTKRLVQRCRTVSWLVDAEPEIIARSDSPVQDSSNGSQSPLSPSRPLPPQLPPPRRLRKRTDSSKAGSGLSVAQYLTPHMEAARQSSVSMAEVARQTEKPGIITPSRNVTGQQSGPSTSSSHTERPPPPPPKARKAGFLRPRAKTGPTETELVNANVATGRKDMGSNDDEENVNKDDDIASLKTETTQDNQNPRKPPPPAPKARRGWRLRTKSKDNGPPETQNTAPPTETGPVLSIPESPLKLTTSIPSSILELDNPFSPPAKEDGNHPSLSFFPPSAEKTLDPVVQTESAVQDNLENKESGHEHKSISTALAQAQAKAVQDIEQMVEVTHVDQQDHPPPLSNHPKVTSTYHLVTADYSTPTAQDNHTVPTIKARHTDQLHQDHHHAVLAPPSEAPIRGVPGPRIELERSPFLSDLEEDAESDSIPKAQTSREDTPKQTSNHVGLGISHRRESSRDSWEDD